MHDWSNTAEVFSRILHGMLASFLIHEYKQTCKKQLFVISHNLNVRSKEVSIVSLPQDILKHDFKKHMGHFPEDGENGQNVAFFHNFLELRCEQTLQSIQLFSTVLKRFCPGHSKNLIFFWFSNFD